MLPTQNMTSQYSPLPTDDVELQKPLGGAAAATSNDIEMTDEEVAARLRWKMAHRKSATNPSPETDEVEIPEWVDLTSPWRFIDGNYMRWLLIVVLTLNTGMIGYEMADPQSSKMLSLPDIVILSLYAYELVCKALYLRRYFLCGPFLLVIWSLLDIVILMAGLCQHALAYYIWMQEQRMAEQERTYTSLEDKAGTALQHKSSLVAHVLLRVVRLLQLVKTIRLILSFDLSWTEEPWFQSFIGGVIVFNSLLMGLETDIEWEGWFYIEQFLLVIYSFELLVRLKKQGVFFLRGTNPDVVWNWLDFAIVVSSAVDSWAMPLFDLVLGAVLISEGGGGAHKKKGGGFSLSSVMMLMRMLRLLRILRLVKLVKAVEPLYILVVGISSAVQGVFWVLILTIVIIYAMAIISTRLVGQGLVFEGGQMPDAEDLIVFENVPKSMFTLFRVMSGAESDDEAMKMDGLMKTLPTMKFAFVFFMVTSSWTLLSILTAVVSENMINTCSDQQAELHMISDEEDREAHLRDLKGLFTELDVNCNGQLEKTELDAMLTNKELQQKIAHVCRVPSRNVREVFRTLTRHGELCTLDHFLGCMLEVAKPVNELSVMKIIANIFDATSLARDQNEVVDESLEKVLRRLDAKEQAHSEAIMSIERSNTCRANDILATVNLLCKRQDEIKERATAREDALAARIDSLERTTRDLFMKAHRNTQVPTNNGQIVDNAPAVLVADTAENGRIADSGTTIPAPDPDTRQIVDNGLVMTGSEGVAETSEPTA